MLKRKLLQSGKILSFLLIFTLFSSLGLAYTPEENDLESQIRINTTNIVLIASALVLILIVYATLAKRMMTAKKNNLGKVINFSLIVIVVLVASIYTAGATIYLNSVSESKGPVHWHADFEVWKCGQKLDLNNPSGISNRIGTPTFHEHGDDRIHLEGVVVKKDEVALNDFFRVVGSSLTPGSMTYNTADGMVTANDGDTCNGQPGKLQVFVYKTTNPPKRGDWIYEQVKIEDYSNYVLSPFGNVPPADCIIIEFDKEKSLTDKICETYRVAIANGDMHGG